MNHRLTHATSDLDLNLNPIVCEELARANAEDGKQVIKILYAIYSHLTGKNPEADETMRKLVNDQCTELWDKVACMEQIIAEQDDMAVSRTDAILQLIHGDDSTISPLTIIDDSAPEVQWAGAVLDLNQLVWKKAVENIAGLLQSHYFTYLS
ncbi:hypothetical protein EON65_41080 [archaeon]|nr:MAG: hypothetical protein EON65_41080 [archaeon]